MTVNEYLSNPYGKGSAFSSVGQQKRDLDAQYERLLHRITCKIYVYRNTAYYHVIVPSQRDEQTTYDVVVEIPFIERTEADIDLSNRDFKVFSNCPSFIFTYAHVFRGRKMLCEWLVDKYNEYVRKKAATVANPYGIIGFERSLYLALKYLKTTGKLLATTIRLDPWKPVSRDEIAREVRTQDQIMSHAKAKVKPNDKSVSKQSTPPKNEKPKNHSQNSGKTTKTVKTTKVGKVKNTKTTNKI